MVHVMTQYTDSRNSMVQVLRVVGEIANKTFSSLEPFRVIIVLNHFEGLSASEIRYNSNREA